MKLVVDHKYQSKYGLLTYTGFFPGTDNFYCDRCDRRRPIHEFLLGDYPQHTQVYHYGNECLKHFIKETELKEE